MTTKLLSAAGILFLILAMIGQRAVAQDPSFELVMTFEFSPDTPTSTDLLSVLIGFDGGAVGVNVGSVVVPHLDVIDNQLFLTILIEPPPPSEVTVPSFFLLHPMVELGRFPSGEYQLQAEVFFDEEIEPRHLGQTSFVVVPEPSTIALSVLAFLVVITIGRSHGPLQSLSTTSISPRSQKKV